MRRIELRTEPLTQASFAPFGNVIATDGVTPVMINGGNTERYDALSKVTLSDENDSAVINIFRAQPRSLPMRIEMMERHPLGSQSFHPLSGEDYLVLVAEAGSELGPEHLHLFRARKDQGINYHRNTWHHPVLALNNYCDFLVVDRKGLGGNCEEFFFNKNLYIELTAEAAVPES